MFSAKYKYLFITLLSGYSYLNIKFTEGDQLLPERWPEWILITIISVTVLFVWEGNRFVTKYLAVQHLNNTRSLIFQFAISTFLVLVLSLGSFVIQNVFMEQFSWLPFKLALGFGFRINLFLNAINAIVFYQQRLSKAELRAEQLKKETALAQMESLKRQIKPHFLFNSLNVLDSLVRSNPESASLFIEKLSNVYRYLTNVETEELVLIDKEIDFIEDYVFLMETRFKENLSVIIDITAEHKLQLIPPSTLQLLLENAIKHNQISRLRPLKISILSHDSEIVVRNKKQQKISTERRNGVGLENIKSRYKFLDKMIEVNEDDDNFTVKVPVINNHDKGINI